MSCGKLDLLRVCVPEKKHLGKVLTSKIYVYPNYCNQVWKEVADCLWSFEVAAYRCLL